MSIVNCKVKYLRPKYENVKKWCEDENNVYIGRGGVVFIEKERYPKKSSIFANPFKIGKDGNREEVIEKYKIYMKENIEKNKDLQNELLLLKGKNLGCWCHPQLCHGNILLDMIDELLKE
jgi:hypothetical protein